MGATIVVSKTLCVTMQSCVHSSVNPLLQKRASSSAPMPNPPRTEIAPTPRARLWIMPKAITSPF